MNTVQPDAHEQVVVTETYHGPDRRKESPMIGAGAIADQWVPILGKGGLAAIAVFLVYILTIELRTDIAGIKADVAKHVTASAMVEKTMNSLVNVTVQQCINVSTTDAKKDACFTAMAFAPVRDPK